MFCQKDMRLIAGSLLAVSILLSTWSAASMLHARIVSSDFDVAGGLTMSGCKDPCEDYWITSVTECQHLSGTTCETDACMINSLRYLKCDCGNAGPDEDDCEYYNDYSDWRRWEVHREMPCNSTTPYTKNYGTCAKSGVYSSSSTPCVYGSCYGELLVDQATAYGRSRCGTTP